MNTNALLVPWDWRWYDKAADSNVSISVIKDPKHQFETERDSFERMVQEADLVVSESFGSHLTGGEGTRSHLLGVDCISVVHQDGRIRGFASVKIYPTENILYLHGIVVHPDLKGMGIGRALLKTLIDHTKTGWLAFTTQNPVMYMMLRSICKTSTFPSHKRPVVPPFLAPIAKELVKGRDGTFHEDTFVIHDLYKHCLYGAMPRTSDESVQSWFDQSLRLDDDGKSRDGFLFLGHRAR
jgi:ribosomal protein S18 acetylase RimI-like enzyme